MSNLNAKITYIRSRFFNKLGQLLFRGEAPFTEKNTLLFLKIDSIGDYILVRNFIQCISQSDKYGKYTITLCGNISWKTLAEQLDSEYIDKFIWIDYDRMQESWYRFQKYLRIYLLRSEKLVHPTYSRCVVSDGIVKHSGAEKKVGFDGDLTNLSGEQKKENDTAYTSLINANSLFAFEFDRNKMFFEKFLESELTIDKPYLSVNHSSEEYIVICPGAKKEFRRWTPDNFAKLCNLLSEIYNGDFIICGSPEDTALASAINKNSKCKFTDYTGKKSLAQLVEIFAKSKLIITNDSGPFHIANVMNKKVVAISNGYHYRRFTPYPAEMKLQGVCIYPKEIKEMISNSNHKSTLYSGEIYGNINAISPEEVYSLILKTYFKIN